MNKRIFLLLFMHVIVLMAYAQRSLNGSYKPVFQGRPLTYIYIEGNTFEYVDYRFAYDYIMCKATFNWANKHFIELQSVTLKNIVEDSLQVHQFKSDTDDDSLTVDIFIPNQNMTVLYLPKNDDRGVWGQAEPTVVGFYDYFKVKLPAQTGKIVLKMEPYELFWPASYPAKICDKHYNAGYLYYVSPEITVKEGVNSIKIEMPIQEGNKSMNYVANGEYVRVKGDKIIWHGSVFKRVGEGRLQYPRPVVSLP